jgi:hypothetical protein
MRSFVNLLGIHPGKSVLPFGRNGRQFCFIVMFGNIRMVIGNGKVVCHKFPLFEYSVQQALSGTWMNF